MRRINAALLAAVLAGGLSMGVAEAGFPHASQQVTLDFLQDEVTVIFEAEGQAIRSVKPLCDCMEPSVQGQRLVVRVDTSTFDRDTVKELEATLADGSRQRLAVRFVVPQLLEISSRTLVWKLGSEPKAQVLHISIPKGSPVRELRRAELVGDGFTYEPKVLRQGRAYAVTILPVSTAKPVLNRLQLVTDCDDYRARRVIFLQVRR